MKKATKVRHSPAQKRKIAAGVKRSWEKRRVKEVAETARLRHAWYRKHAKGWVASTGQDTKTSATGTLRSDDFFEIADRIKYLEARGFKVTKA